MPDFDPKTPFIVYEGRNWFYKHYPLVGSIVAIVAVFATVIATSIAWCKQSQALLFTTLFLWAIVPPATFWWEYFFVYLKYGKAGSLEHFRYGQQVSAAMWAGVLVVLIAIGSSDNVKKNDRRDGSDAGPTGANQANRQD